MSDGPFTYLVNGEFHKLVPRDPLKNLAFRSRLLQECEDNSVREAIRYACENDFFFWLNTFGWVYEPRGPFSLPFCTWPFQEEALTTIFSALGITDVGIEKSRDMGATWFVLAAMTHLFQFTPNAAMGAMSRYEEQAVAIKSPKSLFWKVDFLLKNQPAWLRPRYSVNTASSTIMNETNGSSISGSSTTKDSARGDRYLLFFMDEAACFEPTQGYDAWASTQSTTNTRIVASTPQGMVGVFYDVMRSGKATGVRKATLHWTKHPLKARGLYTSDAGRLRVLDKTYPFPKNYPFILDGKKRSPWYDKEESRSPSKRHLAQEVDIDYGGAGAPFFEMEIIQKHRQKYAKRPVRRFAVDFNEDTHECSLYEHRQGHLLVWYQDIAGDPPHDSDYVIGADIATGRGGEMSTNSVLSIVNLRSGEKVAEYASNTITPDDFAHLAIAMRRHFFGPGGDAWLIWEANGPGGIFGQVVMKHSPARIYYRRRESTREKKRTNEPGWWSKGVDKINLFSVYQQCLRKGRFINRHGAALDECSHYVYNAVGMVIHDRSSVADDPSVAKENHGDRVIADALACKLLYERPAAEIKPFDPKSSPLPTDLCSFGGRLRLWQRKQSLENSEQW